MAIIKCPECGHQISDKAPTCPSCGVEIKGKIIKCSQCGEVYLYDQEMCPNCHHTNFGPITTNKVSDPYENQQNPRRLTEDLFENEFNDVIIKMKRASKDHKTRKRTTIKNTERKNTIRS